VTHKGGEIEVIPRNSGKKFRNYAKLHNKNLDTTKEDKNNETPTRPIKDTAETNKPPLKPLILILLRTKMSKSFNL
jgi:hypothetical protein